MTGATALTGALVGMAAFLGEEGHHLILPHSLLGRQVSFRQAWQGQGLGPSWEQSSLLVEEGSPLLMRIPLLVGAS